ncbi:putative RNA-binding Zn ribbon-like protein [Sphingomonas sp. UYAg733]
MRLSDKFLVPAEIALLYDFVNSLDLRDYVEGGAVHVASDELSTISGLEGWLRGRGLLNDDTRLGAPDHGNALGLRRAIRLFLALDPATRGDDAEAGAMFAAAATGFPMIFSMSGSGEIALRPAPGASALGYALAELHLLSQSARLDRLKMCASDECGWVFFDRSKPGNRRWCSSTRCGNRHKTRAYRDRKRHDAPSP